MTQAEGHDLDRISEENFRKRQTEAPAPVMVRMRKSDHEPPEMEVDSNLVWAYKVAGWSEV